MHAVTHRTIDDALGHHESRYFGAGHKRTRYGLRKLELVENGARSVLSVSQDGLWSQKDTGANRPHLSTIDIVVTTVLTVERYLQATGRGDPADLAGLRVTRVQIRTGSQAIEDLDDLAVTLEESASTSSDLRFTCRIGTMWVSMTLRPGIRRPGGAPARHAPDFYAEHLKNHLQDVRDITTSLEEVSAEVTVSEVGGPYTYSGIQSALAGHLSALDYVLSFAQLAQVLAYHHDSMDRATSETFWLRSLTLAFDDTLVPLGTRLHVAGRITRPRVLTLGGRPWRLFTMATSVPSVTCTVEVAHILHERTAA